ncbi:MAG: thiolase family protein [Pseudolabrys sp.]|nr:thiolase family protein [Pseudolabrys sp.]
MADPIVILGGARTAFGSFNGALASQSATVLGGHAIASALVKSGVAASDVDDVVMGVVLPAGMGQAPARQAAAKAGIPWSANCVTVNKMCGSGMQAIIQAHDAVSLGTSNVVVAGGMESMTNAPHLLRMRENPSLRNVTKPNAVKAEDHLLLDGLCDSFGSDARLMGHFAEATAERYQFSRQEQDAFAIASLTRAQRAADGFLQDEITPVTIATRKGPLEIAKDEQPQNAAIEKIPTLRPVFTKDGSVTAANSSSISDGAAAVVITSLHRAEKLGAAPLAHIVAHTSFSREPEWFTLAPIDAIRNVAAKAGWSLASVDRFEINEAFAVVVMAAMRELGLAHENVNVHGGACALGHPVGASGARLVLTLARNLKASGLKRGIAAICIGGGEATAVAIEIVS